MMSFRTHQCARLSDMATVPLTPNIHILLIEDNPIDSLLMQHILARENAAVTSCQNGRQAWNLINTMAVPDLVVLDLMLPEIPGLTLLKHIRSKPAWSRVKVVVVSATEQRSEVKNAINLGVVDFIKKPYDLIRISEDLNAIFDSVDSRRHLPGGPKSRH